MRKTIVAGNWKMFGNQASVADFATRLSLPDNPNVEVVIFPPVGYLAQLALAARGSFEVGGQNIHAEPQGAFTGEMSGAMVRDLGGQWVLVGHSERRAYNAETDTQIADKVAAALAIPLVTLLCVGETLAEREAGQAEACVAEQLRVGLSKVISQQPDDLVVAYEPVWAIGTGQTASPDQAQQMHRFIRGELARMSQGVAPTGAASVAENDSNWAASCPVLYGGSVNAENAAALFACPDIDGGLVGGASLDPETFAMIVAAATT